MPVTEPSARIRALFGSGSMPEAVAREVLAAREWLSEGAVAVRSSATAEDLAGASFAGQQDTFLNVRGVNALLAAVRDCWASLWTARAMAYRARQGIDPATVALAVVVQRMVDGVAAGVHVYRESCQWAPRRDRDRGRVGPGGIGGERIGDHRQLTSPCHRGQVCPQYRYLLVVGELTTSEGFGALACPQFTGACGPQIADPVTVTAHRDEVAASVVVKHVDRGRTAPCRTCHTADSNIRYAADRAWCRASSAM